MPDQRRMHLVEILERLAVVEHQIAEVADACRQLGENDTAAALSISMHGISLTRELIERMALDGGKLPPA